LVAGTKVAVGRGLFVADTLMEAIWVGRTTVAGGAAVAVGGMLVAEAGASVGGCVSVAGT
jgi:hypothetical protein